MTTAIDQHFTDAGADSGFDPEMESNQGNALPTEPKKKSGKGSTIAIIGIAALAISAGGFVVMKRFSGAGADEGQQVIADAAPMQQQAQSEIIEDALVPPSNDLGAASQVVPASASAPFEPVAPTNPVAVPAVQPAGSNVIANAQQAPAVPQPVAPAATPSPAPSLTQAPAPAHTNHAVGTNQGNDAETAKLSASLDEAKQRISRLEGDLQKLRSELSTVRQTSAKPAVTRAAPSPAKAPVKPAPKPAEKSVAQTKQPETKSVESAFGRSDFRIYAMRDGQAWVQDLKTRETIPAAPGSMLPDGSKVTKINEAQGVISTTAGEIRYTSFNRAN